MKILLIGFCLIANIAAEAQGDVLWMKMKSKYPEEPAVFLDRTEELTLFVKNDSLQGYSDISEDVLLLKNQTEAFVNRKIHGSHFNKVSNLSAKTLVLTNSRYKEQSVSGFTKKSDTDDGVFFDDSFYYAFSFPSVAEKNRTELKYRNELKDLRFLSGFVFASYLPQEKNSYTIHAPKDLELVFKVWNDPDNTVKFEKRQKGNTTTYEWKATDVKPWKFDAGSPPLRYFVPHLVVYIKSFYNGSKKQNVLSNLDDLYSWYSTFLSKLNDEPSAELKSIVAQLVRPGDSESDKVKKIFYWVQENIRYIAFEEGMRGLVPHNGSYVCEKRYGDCKDMASIIVTMMKSAGVKGYYTWVGTRDLPYKYSEVPTPLVDNHMIATYIDENNNYYFLDGTSNHTAFGLPSSMIQGKEVLIGKRANEYEVKVVPEVDERINLMKDSTTLRIVGNELFGSGQVSLSGIVKTFAGYELNRSQKDAEQKNAQEILSRGSNKFLLDKYEIVNLDKHDVPTLIKYQFRIGDYFRRAGNELYVNLNLSKDFYNNYIEATRSSPKENEYKYVKEEYYSLQIPEGYEVEYIPESLTIDGSLLSLDLQYQKHEATIVLRKKMSVKYLMLMPDQFQRWNEDLKKISDAYKATIILKKK